ncbi:MAG: hypothetical protein IT475_06480 [Aquimonas sp.]|nr:hypothetical protein [Aquimonas sp.]
MKFMDGQREKRVIPANAGIPLSEFRGPVQSGRLFRAGFEAYQDYPPAAMPNP